MEEGEHRVFMPFIANAPASAESRTTIPFGYAIYGVAHEVHHGQMEQGHAVHGWYTAKCCMTYPDYYPSISQMRYYQGHGFYAKIAREYPGRTWYLWNEPDVPNQANITPQQAIPITREWVAMIREYGGKVAGYGVTVVHAAHWLKDRWMTWLQEWIDQDGPVPDYFHVHVYAQGVQEWDDLWGRWDEWNTQHWNLPTILSEVGQGPAVMAHLRALANPKIVRMHWFTNFTDTPMDGIP